MYYKVYKTSGVLCLTSCWLWGRWGLLNAIPRSLLALMQKLVGPTCCFVLTQQQQTTKNQCSSKGKGISLVWKSIWKHKISDFSSAQEDAAESSFHFQCRFLPEHSFIRGLNSTRLTCTDLKANSACKKKKVAMCFYNNIESILLTNPVCSLLPCKSCFCGCQRGKESWSVPWPKLGELNALSQEPFTFPDCSENLEGNQKQWMFLP